MSHNTRELGGATTKFPVYLYNGWSLVQFDWSILHRWNSNVEAMFSQHIIDTEVNEQNVTLWCYFENSWHFLLYLKSMNSKQYASISRLSQFEVSDTIQEQSALS